MDSAAEAADEDDNRQEEQDTKQEEEGEQEGKQWQGPPQRTVTLRSPHCYLLVKYSGPGVEPFSQDTAALVLDYALRQLGLAGAGPGDAEVLAVRPRARVALVRASRARVSHVWAAAAVCTSWHGRACRLDILQASHSLISLAANSRSTVAAAPVNL
eukprot:jgi/Chlat1/1935/Chrsp153S02246